MVAIDPTKQTERDNYKLLTGSIIPRPVAFVTTKSKQGTINAAPYSYFNIVTSNPPMISISVQRKNGEMKDTARNANECGEFVVHISDETYIDSINQTAANLPSDQSEIKLTSLTTIPSTEIDVPGIKEAQIRMECVIEHSIPLGGTGSEPACDLLIGRVVYFHIADELYNEGKIRTEKLLPVSRLAGNDYAKLGEFFSLERPE
ncbi:flavin reductase family protein [Paenibacillus sp. Marseille-Q4541]|uniref:flavin reductase family protein n=1 Tax=Paenibacillus sp. Marseille-Q4541 TaxID=2831522 RepID=UPI001BAE54EE|nr:flavin reductase family protein [Paenibacillus sp. Marseille-Q4541]